MGQALHTLGIDSMSVEERIDLVKDIWDSVAIEAGLLHPSASERESCWHPLGLLLLFSCRESWKTSAAPLGPRATRRSLLPTRLRAARFKNKVENIDLAPAHAPTGGTLTKDNISPSSPALSESPATCLQSPAHILLYPRRQPCLVRHPRPYGGILGMRKSGHFTRSS